MPVHVRIHRKSHPFQTGGASIKSPSELISGTVVPALTPEVYTAGIFSCDTIIVGRIFASQDKNEGHLREPIAKKRRRRRGRKNLPETRRDMIPVYCGREAEDTVQPALLRAVNTPLATKAEEEMSDFEREYPW